MGVVLQFPGSGPEQGAGQHPVPSGVPQHTEQGAPGWAVPGVDPADGTPAQRVDASEPVPPPNRDARRASNVAMAALTRHDASESELRATLVQRGLEEVEVEAELDRLRGAGLLDDAALAARLVAGLRQRKGLGDAALRPALRARGIPSEVVDTVLADHPEDQEVVEERLQEVADARARRLGGLAHDVAERRLTAFLLRKGYGGSAARGAARSALDRAVIR